MASEEHELFAAAVAPDERLHVDVDGYEGPLDLLLDLARRQKIDLERISVLALAEQYLAFVEAARDLRLDLAMDYLVMAAWLAFLKSRLLLPRAAAPDEPDPDDLAAALADRLRRLDRIRIAAKALEDRPRIGRDLALRGLGDDAAPVGDQPRYAATIYDLMAAYARQRGRRSPPPVRLIRRQVLSLPDARAALTHYIARAGHWLDIDDVVREIGRDPAARRSARASILAVVLEMVREGRLAMRQDDAFAPIRIAAVEASG